MTAPIVVSLLLRTPTESSIDALRSALDALSLGERTEGRAAWTVRVDPARFEALFGARARPIEGRPPGPADMGSPPGYAVEGELTVPDELSAFVERATVEPPFTRFRP